MLLRFSCPSFQCNVYQTSLKQLILLHPHPPKKSIECRGAWLNAPHMVTMLCLFDAFAVLLLLLHLFICLFICFIAYLFWPNPFANTCIPFCSVYLLLLFSLFLLFVCCLFAATQSVWHRCMPLVACLGSGGVMAATMCGSRDCCCFLYFVVCLFAVISLTQMHASALLVA